MKNELLVIGDAAVDQYMQIDAPDSCIIDPKTNQKEICFLHGSKIQVKRFKATLAGNVTHVGIGIQKLGIQTAIYTELGDDDNANKFIKEFEKQKIDTSFCIKNKNTNTNVHTIIASDGERTIFSYHKPRNYKLDFNNLASPKWIFYTSLADGFEEFQKELVSYIGKNSETILAFNPGTVQLKAGIDKLKNVLAVTRVLFVNKQEAQKLTQKVLKEVPLRKLHEELHQLGPKLSVITDGSNGSSSYDGEKFYTLEATKIEGGVIDKTGAGDAYSAAFLAALHYKKTLKEAMAWGNKNCSSTVKSIGCLDGLLTLQQITHKNKF